MNRIIAIIAATIPLALLSACNDSKPTSDQVQSAQQERILQEGTSQVGMPAIKNFRERKVLKDVLEKRDQEGLVTYTYLFSEVKGCMVFLGDTIGYPLPYATQFTNPQKLEYSPGHGYVTTPQADPNGLFSPSSAEGTWLLMKDPRSDNVGVIYTEPKVIALPFRAPESSVCKTQ